MPRWIAPACLVQSRGMNLLPRCAASVLLLALVTPAAVSENGSQGWLRYAIPPDPARYHDLPHAVLTLGSAVEEKSAAEELDTGLGHMIGAVDETLPHFDPHVDAFILGTPDELRRAHLAHELSGWSERPIGADGFRIAHIRSGIRNWWVLEGASPRGVLYAAFRFNQMVAEDRQLPDDLVDAPGAPIRWTNEWDNLDGSVERGYAGPSIFFEDGHVRSDLKRAGDYARLLASVGINGCTVNNVNSDLAILKPETMEGLARIANAMRPWGVHLSLSVDLSSPKAIGGLPTFDPLDPSVQKWWQAKVDEIYRAIPDFAGFVVKADSEDRPGPHQYGRTPADGANVLARPLAKHGGVVLYRAFVYNHHLDWRDPKADRARAAYDIFHPLDGKFDPNVVVLIKNGPIDFQVREPVSPLLAGMPKTNVAIELQITNEYTGQARHMVYLAPMWTTVLNTDMHAEGRYTPVREIVEGRSFHHALGGFAGVANVGMEPNWMHHPMAMANLYAFGRLAWDPTLEDSAIADEWTRLTWSNDGRVYRPVESMLMASWQAYEDYTGPLGLGTLTDITGSHFGPGIESAERNGWGQWLRADHNGIGMDRTVATGTGFIDQYPSGLAAEYERLDRCPDELLLFFHHVPYTHRLHSGKTVIQHVYDSHFTGAVTAANFVDQWEQVQGLVDPERYEKVHQLLLFQSHHAEVWRDAVDDWFLRISGIPDQLGYVGHHPGRIEAESMALSGYTPVKITPAETGSGGEAVVCPQQTCTAATVFHGEANVYRVEVGYYDTRLGESSYDLLVNGKPVARWVADDQLPPARVEDALNGDTASRYVVNGVKLQPGDTVAVQGTTDKGEHAPLDFVEITRDPRWN